MSADALARGFLLLLGRWESMFFHSFVLDVNFVHPFANTRDIQHQGARVMQENGDKQCVSESCTTMAPSTMQYFSYSMAREQCTYSMTEHGMVAMDMVGPFWREY